MTAAPTKMIEAMTKKTINIVMYDGASCVAAAAVLAVLSPPDRQAVAASPVFPAQLFKDESPAENPAPSFDIDAT